MQNKNEMIQMITQSKIRSHIPHEGFWTSSSWFL